MSWPAGYYYRGYYYVLNGFRKVPFWNNYGLYSIVVGTEYPPPRRFGLISHPHTMHLTLEKAQELRAQFDR